MRVDENDEFGAMTEIMNMSNDNKDVYVTIIYEYVPLATPGYRAATHLRIDITECGGSHVAAKRGAYQYSSPEWESPYAGVILHSDGHGHAGTDHVDLKINGKSVCDSIQYYGLRKDSIMTEEGMGRSMGMEGGSMEGMGEMDDDDMEGMGMEFSVTSDTIMCEKDAGRVEKGDMIQTVAYFNSTKYPQMVFRGKLEGVSPLLPLSASSVIPLSRYKISSPSCKLSLKS